MSRQVYLNGEFIAAEQATVPVTDLGVLYGIGLFETMRAYDGRIFCLQQHLERLLESARTLNLPITPEMMPSPQHFSELLQRNTTKDARVRLTVTGGSPQEQGIQHRVLVTAVPLEAYPKEYYTRGVTVAVHPQPQLTSDLLAGHKVTCYWARLNALHTARLKGCAEALWFTEQKLLAEGSISNVFIVKDDFLRTPPLDTPILPGISRAVVTELCAQLKIPCHAVPLTINDLLDAEEAFLTNAIMELVPICRVERKPIGDEKVGALTQKLSAAYKQRVAGSG